MSRRDQIRMSDEEVEAFLAEQRTVHLATLGTDGTPHLTTLWYGLVDGRIAVWTYAKSQKVKNLERDPRITALVETGDSYGTLRGVQIQGTARMSTERDDVMEVARAVYAGNASRFGAVEYQGDALDDDALSALDAMSAKRVAIVVEPRKVISWDHAKLGGVY